VFLARCRKGTAKPNASGPPPLGAEWNGQKSDGLCSGLKRS